MLRPLALLLLSCFLSAQCWHTKIYVRALFPRRFAAAAANLLLLPFIPFGPIDIGYPMPAHAAMRIFPSAEQSALDDIAGFQKPVNELFDQLKPTLTPNPIGVWTEMQFLRDGPEDAAVVFLNMENYIKPLQTKMANVAPRLELPSTTDKDRIVLLPLLMKGHILELDAAIKTQKAEGMRKEVEEVQETLAEFLKLASTGKYDVARYIPSRPLTDKEYLGPLGCEFWGKVRVEGSNACTNPTEKQ